MSIGPPIPGIQHFLNLTLKIQGQGQMTMMLHNYRDMGSTKSGPSAAIGSKSPNNYDVAQLQV